MRIRRFVCLLGLMLVVALSGVGPAAAVPGVTVTISGPTHFVPGAPLTYAGRVMVGALVGVPSQSVELRVDGIAVATVTTDLAGTWSANVTLAYPPESHTLVAVAFAGSASESPSFPLHVTVVRHRLSVTRSGTGASTGTVVSSPAGINCGTECFEDLPHGERITLTAEPSSSTGFTGWSGACSGASHSCTLTMDGPRTVDASFTPFPTVRFSLPSSSVGEATSSAGIAVALSAPWISTVTVDYAVTGGSATGGGTDHSLSTGQLTFAPGDTAESIVAPITDDVIDESDETVGVVLSSPTNAVLGSPGTHTLTILDDDPEPAVGFALSTSAVAEGNNTSTTVLVSVSLSAQSSRTVTVGYTTADDTATAGIDYTTGSGTLSFLPGQTSQTVAVSVRGDSTDEDDETFTVNLSNAINATLGTATHMLTITNDDPAPTVGFVLSSSSITENSGIASLTVGLTATSSRTVTVQYFAADGTAMAGSDYSIAAGTLTFAPGESTKTIGVTILQDALDESAETFTVTLSNATNAIIGTASRTVTILDDNDPPPTVAFTAASSLRSETDGSVSVVVSLSAPSGQTASVAYQTNNGTATTPGDYTAAFGTLTFSPGETSKMITIAIADDALDENDETFTVKLSNATNAQLASPLTHSVTIQDDDPSPTAGFGGGTSMGSIGARLEAELLARA